MHYRRKQSRRKVKCRICTDGRFGNSLKDASKRVKIARDKSWQDET